ncbi:MAG: pentapeptide repeat-containing protein [Scytonematopsis contorta HA4267-MV1]|jgi:uncharacterized protein YjbI with pentapeptide repeats|nr:pentapeptide repeat-containing protein [Scytonematopsis contorta HA4267-MV1]
MPADYSSGQKLRGRSFKGQDLTGANFSSADIRGANFTDAILVGANFSHVQAGLRKRWAVFLILVSCLLTGLSGCFSAFTSYLVLQIFSSGVGNQAAGLYSLMTITSSAIFIIRLRSNPNFILVFTYTCLGALALVLAKAYSSNFAGTLIIASIFAFIGAGTGAGVYAFALGIAFVVGENRAATVAATVAQAFAITFAVILGGVGSGNFTLASASTLFLLSDCISSRMQSGDARYALIREISVSFAACGGTSFRNANLTDANFTEAFLKSTDLREANLARACFNQTQELNCARLGSTYLQQTELREVLVTGIGADKNFGYKDIRGVNLQGANLTDASFIGTNLSEANLQDADLSRAKLALTQLDGTDFTSAILTGACIEDWNINSTTNLDNVICDYIYLKQNQQERRPSSGNFAPGEFTKLFQKVLETVDLIFADGIDWKAFFLSFQELRAKYGEENLSVQAIEKKSGNAFVIRLEVPPETDKAEVEKETKELYEAKLKILESQYRAQLQIKDGQIENFQSQIIEYRQNNTKLIETIQILAARPIQNIIDVKATSESKSMSESKREANFNLQGAQFGGGLVNAETVNAHQIGGNITNNPHQPAEVNNSATKTILILAANPKNTSNLRLDEEVREIDAGLQRAKKRELFDLKQRWAVRVQDVYQALLDFKPQIVHFSGHGDGSDGLALEDDTGMLKLVDNYALAQLFQLFSSSIECVVLNACYSEVQAEAIVKYIPYVIGMNKQIGDKAAIKFATGFYSALGAGESVDFAYKLGCNVIQLDGISEHLTPVIKEK